MGLQLLSLFLRLRRLCDSNRSPRVSSYYLTCYRRRQQRPPRQDTQLAVDGGAGPVDRALARWTTSINLAENAIFVSPSWQDRAL
jgi:hypothetical protein